MGFAADIFHSFINWVVCCDEERSGPGIRDTKVSMKNSLVKQRFEPLADDLTILLAEASTDVSKNLRSTSGRWLRHYRVLCFSTVPSGSSASHPRRKGTQVLTTYKKQHSMMIRDDTYIQPVHDILVCQNASPFIMVSAPNHFASPCTSRWFPTMDFQPAFSSFRKGLCFTTTKSGLHLDFPTKII